MTIPPQMRREYPHQPLSIADFMIYNIQAALVSLASSIGASDHAIRLNIPPSSWPTDLGPSKCVTGATFGPRDADATSVRPGDRGLCARLFLHVISLTLVSKLNPPSLTERRPS